MDNTQEAKRQAYWRLLRYVKPYWGRMTVGIIAGFIVGGSLFGHEKICYVFSVNKIEPTLEEAIFRARNVAAPTNTKKFGYATPCAKTGKCYDCHAPRRICNVLAIYMQKMNGMDVEVVLVGEDLGF